MLASCATTVADITLIVINLTTLIVIAIVVLVVVSLATCPASAYPPGYISIDSPALLHDATQHADILVALPHVLDARIATRIQTDGVH